MVAEAVASSQLAGLIEPYAKVVEAKLAEYLQEVDGPSELAEAMRYAALGAGKRIRPVLLLMCNEACGGRQEEAMAAACAVEMVHAYSLVHDDLPGMDDDDLRRGRATCHKVFGEAIAILAGDALLTEALALLAREVESAELSRELIRELAGAIGAGGMVGGQAADMLTQGKKGDGRMLEYIHRHKTGKLIEVSCRMGGLTAKAQPEELAAVNSYGRSVGLAFQVIDDLLDLKGDAKLTGKAVGKDNRAGKLTYPSVMGAEAALEKVESLGAEAKQAVEPLGRRGEKLLLLVRMLAERVA